jgi:murein DD-endopeptidase MepM/ murein hydrolase activator NlpD
MPYKAKHRGTPRVHKAARTVTRTAAVTGFAAAVPVAGLAGPAGAATVPPAATIESANHLAHHTSGSWHPAAAVDGNDRLRLLATAPKVGTYVVRPGDTLSKIARGLQAEGGWRGLWQRNRTVIGNDPNLIFPGQKLRLTGKAPAQNASAKAETASQSRSTSWALPLESYNLTGRFGQSGSNWSSFHHGLDFAAPSGTPIRAVGAGEIIGAGWDGAYGNRINVRHADGTVTLYAHMSRFARTSGSVQPGTVIGYVGATGNTTGPHMHLEVRPDGGGLDDAIDPFDWLSDKGLNP